MLLLDPALIVVPSALRFRAPQSFGDRAFVDLKTSVARLAGNVQPVKVRPLANGSHELVFGARRVRACLELGVPVAAVAQEISGQRAIVELDASNDSGQVSMYERGCLYESALVAGYFPSRRRLAEALGRSLADVASAAAAAQLPAYVLACITDPRALTGAVAKRLAAAVSTDPAGVERLASALPGRVANGAALAKALAP